MQSGIPDTAADSVAKILAEPNRVWTKDEVVAEFPKPETAPGVGFIYSNPTYKMLGMAAEEVTGSSLPAVMRAEVLDPAGSPETLLMQSGETPTPTPWALPLTSSGLDVADFGTGGALPSISDATFSLAASAMASDAQSLASWAWQLFAGKVVSQESLNTMMTVDPDGKGLGLDKMTDFGPTTAFGRAGSKDGYQSQFFVFPERQVVIAVFVNQGDVDLATIASQLLEASGN
jgi:D-alanyl-D-alanine carboxypeptidase